MTKICSSCGHENKDVATFCGNCGARLPERGFAENLTGQSTTTGSTGAYTPKSSGSTYSSSTSSSSTSTTGSSNDAGSICCGVLIVLFIILLIMAMH